MEFFVDTFDRDELQFSDLCLLSSFLSFLGMCSWVRLLLVL